MQSNSFAQNQDAYHRQSTSHTDLNFAGQGGGQSRLNSTNNLNLLNSPQPHRVLPSMVAASRVTPTSGGGNFNVTPEQLVRPPRPKDENRDLANQSFSFRMLNKWISDSETSAAGEHLMRSKKDEEEERERAAAAALTARKSEGNTFFF
jgi:hypothetical protein